jgi:hypothetical protein
MGRFIVYPAIVATPVVFGFVLWLLSLPITATLDSPTPRFGGIAAWLLLLASGTAFAIVVVLALIAQVWIVRARMAQFVGADFGRVEPLILIPETAIVLALVLNFLVLGRIPGILDGTQVLSAVTVNSIIDALQLFSVGSIALLLGAVLSNQVEALKGPAFLRAMIRGEIGVIVVFLFFIGAYLQIANL